MINIYQKLWGLYYWLQVTHTRSVYVGIYKSRPNEIQRTQFYRGAGFNFTTATCMKIDFFFSGIRGHVGVNQLFEGFCFLQELKGSNKFHYD
jgi:hypothetical protein